MTTRIPPATTGPAERADGWLSSLLAYRDRRIVVVLLLGFSSGLPLLLILSTLSARLREAGIDKSTIGLFGFVLAPYTFKFAWAPLMDRLPLGPLTDRLGRRRGWMLLTQLGLIASIAFLAFADPAVDAWRTALAALLVAFFSASQDIVIDAYRAEILPEERLGAGAGVAVIGYRIGMWAAGAGALLLADRMGWTPAYLVMAALVLIGIVTVLVAPEPDSPVDLRSELAHGVRAWFARAVVEPFTDFFARQGVAVAVAILAFISLYKASDVVLTLMANPFYLDVGFTKTDIAEVSGTFGLFVTLAGGIVGGALAYRIGILRALLVAGFLQGASNLMFAWLASTGAVKLMFYLTILVENLSGGMGTAIFVAYLMSLCNVHYTAVQYALLTSFMQLLGKYLIVPSSGFVAEAAGWWWFFVLSAVLALPGLVLVLWLQSRVAVAEPEPRGAVRPAG